MELNFEGLEVQNTPIDRAQRVVENNVASYYVYSQCYGH